METSNVNRLPMLTYRYLHTNESKLPFAAPARSAKAVFSADTFVETGAELPESFKGASAEWKSAALSGESFTVKIPAETETELTISISCDEKNPDYAGAFRFVLGKGAKLKLIYRFEGGQEKGAVAMAGAYALEEGAELSVSHLAKGMEESLLCFQRYVETAAGAKAHFASAELGGGVVIVNSRGILRGKASVMHESDLYAAGGERKLDFFYHIDHLGEDTESDIDVKGALAGKAKKIFRGTIDFKRGSAGAVGSEGDYAIQLDPETKNISLPLLLCTEDNVQGNHASSAGQIDQGTVYYLMTRGFTYEEARRIVVESLIRPLVDRMDESLREEAIGEVRKTLDGK